MASFASTSIRLGQNWAFRVRVNFIYQTPFAIHCYIFAPQLLTDLFQFVSLEARRRVQAVIRLRLWPTSLHGYTMPSCCSSSFVDCFNWPAFLLLPGKPGNDLQWKSDRHFGEFFFAVTQCLRCETDESIVRFAAVSDFRRLLHNQSGGLCWPVVLCSKSNNEQTIQINLELHKNSNLAIP